MPFFKTSQEWLEKSSLLIEARPKTTRVTTRYSIKPAPAGKQPKSTTTTTASPTTTATTTTTTTTTTTITPSSTPSDAAARAASTPKPPRGSIVLTTYDPVTGVNLKYRTTKAAEVSRLVQAALGRLGRCMAGLPAETPDEPMPDAPASAVQGVIADNKHGGNGGAATPAPAQQAQAAQSGGGRKKKKGRK
ncbi:uncharacterized protein CPUR_06123 [Claviceps purpurea 20.1]|uniref:SRP9 domain-containing protein n=1 Tax=Claviceps purpurea (strain 20.1) TaxID=1111077 RepID=M1WDL5_CLAP2|nr:uncharacterized protein CPUR_06123 [Claviceps purpurea 20.1]